MMNLVPGSSRSRILSLLLTCTILAACADPGSRRNGAADAADTSPTFARSFGGPFADDLVDFGVDQNGELWLLGEFRQRGDDANVSLNDRPWLANLDVIGDIEWQLSPDTEQGREALRFTKRLGFADGGALYAGDIASRTQESNVVVQRQNANGDVLWTTQLDGSATWESFGLTFGPQRPGSDETLFSLLGDESTGWWVVASSQALGFDAGLDAAFGAPMVFAWFLDPNGVVSDRLNSTPGGNPIFFGSVDINRRDNEENAANAVSTHPVAARLLRAAGASDRPAVALMIQSTSSARNINQIALVYGVHANGRGEITSSVPDEDAHLDVGSNKLPGEVLIDIFERNPNTNDFFSAESYLQLLVPGNSGGSQQYAVAKFDRDRELQWTRGFSGASAPIVNALAQTRWTNQVNSSGPEVAQSRLWAGGSQLRDGQRVPTVWRLSTAGEVDLVCEPVSFVGPHQAISVVAMERLAEGDRLRVLMTTRADDLGGPALLETVIDEDCTETPTLRLAYESADNLARDALQDVVTQPAWNNINVVGGTADDTLRVLDIANHNRIFRFSTETGQLVDTIVERRRQSDTARATGIGLTTAVDEALRVIVTTDAGQIKEFDESGENTLHLVLATGVRQPLFDPSIDTSGRTWMIGGESGSDLLRLDTALNLIKLNFPDCFWIPEQDRDPSRTCLDPEILTLDNNSANQGVLHVLGRGQTHSRNAREYRHFWLSIGTASDPTTRLRFLPQEINDLVRGELGADRQSLYFQTDSLPQGETAVEMINVYRAPPPQSQQVPPALNDNLAIDLFSDDNFGFKLYHYGATENQRWALDTGDFPLIEAVLAHDGGVILLSQIVDITLTKFSADGRPQWSRVYGTLDHDDKARGLRRTQNGYAIAASSRGVDAATPFSQDMWVLQVGLDGRIQGDGQGTDFCQAVVNELSAEQTYNLFASTANSTLPIATLPETTINWFSTVVETLSLPRERSLLASDNTARQCSGDATNDQEPPFSPENPSSILVTVIGGGEVELSSAASSPFVCTNECSVRFMRNEQVSLVPSANSDWLFSGWSGDAACSTDSADGSLTLVTGAQRLACTATFVRVDSVPTASFTATPNTVVLGDSVSLDGNGSSDDTRVIAWDWDFGNDGSIDSTGPTTTFTPQTIGATDIRLQVTDNDGQTAEVVQSVTATAANSAPVARINFSPTTGVTVATAVAFDGSASTDTDGTIDPVSGYVWDFDSNGVVDATGINAVFSYASPGAYDITLEVIDNDGATDTEIAGIFVDAAGAFDPTLTVTLLGGAGSVVSNENPPLINCARTSEPEVICTASVTAGDTVELIPSPTSIGASVVWTGCDQDIGIEGCTVNMNQNRSVSLTFGTN